MVTLNSTPTVTQDDLIAFHSRTFGANPPAGSLPVSDRQSLQYNAEPELDDGLGYYIDGQERTLTDEQIAMFRSSEIYGILRKRELARERGEGERGEGSSRSNIDTIRAFLPNAEVAAMDNAADHKPKSKRTNKKQKLENSSWRQPEREPDLPSRRVIRELDDVQAEDQVLDY